MVLSGSSHGQIGAAWTGRDRIDERSGKCSAAAPGFGAPAVSGWRPRYPDGSVDAAGAPEAPA
jgi:hypothetical protein